MITTEHTDLYCGDIRQMLLSTTLARHERKWALMRYGEMVYLHTIFCTYKHQGSVDGY